MTTFWSAIVNGAFLSIGLSATLALALRLTPRHWLNAATRYAILWTALAVTLAMPLGFLKWKPDQPVPFTLHQPSRIAPRFVPAMPQSSAPSEGLLPLRIGASPVLQPLLFAWILAAIVLLSRVALSFIAANRRSARAHNIVQGLMQRWLHKTNCTRRHVRLASTDEITVPMATGPLNPAVLIPAELYTKLSAEDLDQIGLHETAHLARFDDYALCLQRIIEAMFSLHPAVRWITRQIELEREIACDDIVAASGREARTYADCLTRTVALCGGVRASFASATIAGSRPHLSRRVELLLQAGPRPSASLRSSRFAMLSAALIGAAILLTQTPRLIAFAAPQPATPAQQTAPPVADRSPLAQGMERGFQQMKDRQFDQAIATYTAMLPDSPDDQSKAEIWRRISEAWRFKGEMADAVQAMQQALALWPDHAAYLTNLALLYEAQNDNLDARKCYEKAIAVDPNNPLALNNLAYLLTQTGGDLDQALTYARAAQEKLPTFLEVDDTIGWIYMQKKMPDDAAGKFKILTEKAPNNPEYHYHFAMALAAQGDQAEAVEQLIQARDHHPMPPLAAQIRDLLSQLAPQLDTPSRRLPQDAPLLK